FSMSPGSRYDIMIEYVVTGGSASLDLQWASASIGPLANVPLTRLSSPGAVPAPPTVTPNGGLAPANNVTLTATGGAVVYYTTNGTDPGLTSPATTAGCTLYSTPFTVNAYLKVTARAYLMGVTSPLVNPQ